MSDHTADVIIVGGGVMGCAAAYHLAKDGQRVLLLEQFAVGHSHGSSHGPSRIIRLAYDSADYVQLARASYALWRELEAESGQVVDAASRRPRLRPAGRAGARWDSRDVSGGRRAVRGSSTATRSCAASPSSTCRKTPSGYYQADYSLLAADRCVATLAAQARRHGAIIHENEPARQMHATRRSGVEVRTEQGTYTADRLILSAGSWMRPLLRQLDLDLPLTVTEGAAGVLPARATRPTFMPDRFPLFIHRFPEHNLARHRSFRSLITPASR